MAKEMKSHETLNLIEQITRLDGTKYMEISNMVQNGRAELAAEVIGRLMTSFYNMCPLLMLRKNNS